MIESIIGRKLYVDVDRKVSLGSPWIVVKNGVTVSSHPTKGKASKAAQQEKQKMLRESRVS